MEERAYVEGIYSESLRKDRISKGLANTLNILTKTVFGEANRFVFELLQNADDSPKQKGESEVEVEFVLLQNYLIFRHTGAHFTMSDVNGISDIGSRESQKDKDKDKTGYKGIGFKSVFGTSDCVYIVSENFSFRFDKYHELWKDSQDHPWQIVPIWTETLPDEVVPYINRDYVNTVISITNRVKISEEINAVFQDCQIALFLRHIKSISFVDQGKNIFKIGKREVSNELRELYKNDTLLSKWIIKDFIVTIQDELRAKLSLLSKEECPDKLKEARDTKITFAAMIKSDEIQGGENSLLYCYLPTKVQKGFPYIINADFLTNAERTQFLENEWNTFIFRNIAIKQFDWFAELQKTIFKYQVTRLLRGPFNSYSLTATERAYNENFQVGISQVPFLPEEQGQNLIKLKESIIDTTGFSASFGVQSIMTYLKTNFKVIDLRIQNPNKLISLGALNFNIETLCELLSTKMEIIDHGLVKETNKHLISFFYQKTNENKNTDWLDYLKKTKFLLDENLEYKTPKETYFPLSNANTKDVDFVNLNSLDPDIFLYFSTDSKVLEWLHNIGVKEPSALEIIRKSIFKMIDEDKITESNGIEITRFIFQVYRSGKLNDQDYLHLFKLKLITSTGLQLPKNVYLADEYRPELPLRAILPTANFVSLNYPQDPSERNVWKEFFIKVGVKEKIGVYVDISVTERTEFINRHPETSEYFIWLDKKPYYPSIYEGYKNTGQHKISDFTFVDYLDKLNIYSYSKLFWKSILNNWESFKSKCNHTKYYYRGGNNIVPSFIQYYIQRYPTIPATDGKCYPAKEVYTQHLKNIIGKHFPVADFESYVTKEQAEFLGFKWNVSFSDSFSILRELVTSTINSESYNQISAVYSQIIKIGKDLNAEEREEINSWRKEGKLLALNNTFQAIGQLYYFAVRSLSAPVDSGNFIKLSPEFSFEDIKIFCGLFEIPIITYEKLEFASGNVKIEDKLHSMLTSKAKYFALIYAHQNSELPERVLQKVTEILEETTFYTADSLSLVFKEIGGKEIYNTQIEAWFNTGKDFYYVGNWSSPLTLYSLSNSICTFLELRGIERELALILQLAESEIQNWMKNMGYKIDFEPLPQYSEDQQQLIEVNEPEITIPIEEFKPQIKAVDVSLNNVKTEVKASVEIKLNSNTSHTEIKDTQTRLDIGKWSEEFVFKYLKNEFPHAKIIWENELSESSKPYDFKIEESGIDKFIEVKGTPSEDKQSIYLSDNEWRFMFQSADNYFIYRLFNAGKENLKIKIIPNPSQLIVKGDLMPNPIILQL